MNRLKKIITIVLLCLFLPVTAAFGEDTINYPKLTEFKYVNDYANVLSTETKQKIVSIGNELYTKTKAELLVVTINKLPENVDIKDYANGLFRSWGIGDKNLNNGLLLLASIENRKLWIEVGYGLEGAIPDSYAGRVRDDYILPNFSKGDYNTGILKGYNEFCLRTAGEYKVELSGKIINLPSGSNNTSKTPNILFIIAIVVLFGLDGIFFKFKILRFLFYMMAVNRFRGGRGGGGFGGGSSGGGFGGLGGGSSGGGGAGGNW